MAKISAKPASACAWYLKPFFWNQRRKYDAVLESLLWGRVAGLRRFLVGHSLVGRRAQLGHHDEAVAHALMAAVAGLRDVLVRGFERLDVLGLNGLVRRREGVVVKVLPHRVFGRLGEAGR